MGNAFATPREDAIKSGFIFNFVRYSTGGWFEQEKSDKYLICSFDNQFVEIAALTLKGRTIHNLPVELQFVSPEDNELTGCNTLFISKNSREIWVKTISKYNLSKIMLVGDFDGFIETGGQINFFIVGGKVRFEVNQQKLREAEIEMSSKVLRLGRTNTGAN
jgi:hypothetical protein